MLSNIFRYNLIYSVVIYLLIVVFYIKLNVHAYIYSFVCYISYSLVVLFVGTKKRDIQVNELFFWVFLYTLFFVCYSNDLFYMHHGNFLEYYATDSVWYDRMASYLSGVKIRSLAQSFPADVGFDDKGWPIFLSVLYRIFESNLFSNFINVIINLLKFHRNCAL
jgi:hypothetical protein